MTYLLPEIKQRETISSRFLSLRGSHSLAYHSLQPELSHFQTKYGYIAYVDFHNETIILGNPVADKGNYQNVIAEFLKYRPQCSFIQVDENFSKILARHNFSINYFGVESQIDLPYNLNGKKKKDIRNLSNAAVRNKIKVREIFNRDELYFQATKKNQKKMQLGIHNKEYAFLSRPLNKHSEKDVRIFGAFKKNNLTCFSVFDPMYENDTIVGYAEVISRQLPTSPKGSRTFTLLQAMNQFSTEQIQHVNIGLLPFYPIENRENSLNAYCNNTIDRIFNALYKTSPIVSNFAGLSFHKSRYRGKLLPRYFATNSHNQYKTLLCIYKLTTGNWLPRFNF